MIRVGCNPLSIIICIVLFWFLWKFGFFLLAAVLILTLYKKPELITNIFTKFKPKTEYTAGFGTVYKQCANCGKSQKRTAVKCDQCGTVFE